MYYTYFSQLFLAAKQEIIHSQGLILKILKCVALLLLLSGCTASNHNLNMEPNALGGGFADHKIQAGLYSILAKTNFAPWSDFKAAHKIFNRRATELCGSDSFASIKLVEREFEHIPRTLPPKYIISQVNGYVICESSKLTIKEAEELIQAGQIMANS